MAGVSASMPLDQRRRADALTAAAGLLADALSNKRQPDLEAIRTAAGQMSAQVDLSWLRPGASKPRQALAAMLDAALDNDLACRPAWDRIVRCRREGLLSTATVGRFINRLARRTAGQYPDFSYLLLMQIVPELEDPRRRRDIYTKAMRKTYADREDLQGRLLIALGDDYLSTGQKTQALQLFRAAAGRSVEMAEIVVAAAARAEGIYRQAGQLDQALAMYRELFDRTETVQAGDFFRAQTSHYQLGMRLAGLLDRTGRPREAEKLRKRLQNP
jgi:tetratricopeptide (TPR) repeat protein